MTFFSFRSGLLCAAALLGPICAAAADTVQQTILAEHLPSSAVSFVVLDPESGRVVAAQNPGTPRSPASTIKLVTTFASLDVLGPAYTWHTRALSEGDDLILQGGGDPYMTLERWWSFAHALRNQGLKVIRDIIIDNSAFSLPPEDPGAFDGRPNRAYNAAPDALMVNFQSIEFTVVPNPDARRIDIVANPAPVNLTIENRIRFAPGRCTAAASRVDFEVATERWDRVVFSGALSPHCAQRSFTRVLLHPAEYAYGSFAALWQELGGQITGKLRVEAAPADARLLLSYDSLTLGEIVRLTNKYSSNLMARHLLLSLGEARYGTPATLEKGAAALKDWGRERGLALEDVEIDNGSGLSRLTHISALQMAQVLNAAYHSRYAPEFMASLPLAGIDGTLRSRMKESPGGAVRLKTGHIDGVSGVAGFVTAGSGKTYVLVSLINDARADEGAGEPVHAALVSWMLQDL
jgi:D-alanyl-D-alanine carboxypeptidase/D-alanyl-D-alanine-endopeptidase (penicillin-binding protein 4)